MERDLLASDGVFHVASVFSKMAVEAHVCTPADGQQGLVHIGDLEYYALGSRTPQCHHVTTSLSLVGNGLAICDFVLGPVGAR